MERGRAVVACAKICRATARRRCLRCLLPMMILYIPNANTPNLPPIASAMPRARLGQVAAVSDAVALRRRAVLRRERRLRHCGGGVQPTESSRREAAEHARRSEERGGGGEFGSTAQQLDDDRRREPRWRCALTAVSPMAFFSPLTAVPPLDGPPRPRNAAAAPARPRRARHAALAQQYRLPRRRQHARALAERRRLRQHLVALGVVPQRPGGLLLLAGLLHRLRRVLTSAAAARSTCAAAAPRARSTRATAPST